tara:strand:+ start:135 stop:503 length:369 start_codon:yes stop_codon:yes gene_type:complete
MVRNSFHWNITKEKGFEIIHMNIIEILREQPKKSIPLDQLVTLLNERTKYLKIHSSRKYNTLSKYIKMNYNGIVQFLDDYTMYGIDRNNKQLVVHLFENELEDFNLHNLSLRITKDSEWVFV